MTTTASQIVWPRQALARSIFCMIVRDTRGVALDQAQRFNFFPASPFCSMASVVDLTLVSALERVLQTSVRSKTTLAS
ncbi:hypothetical protein [Bradyrhizobium sp. WD16]|uniref:hypothetical protein n=1 Tax=Bradyrhizobium sp. WD16 TaxID=1521768 RepID=UPI0020A3062E|nr:hypothetical protein [Bradyrhizobium sp. WD16]UTD29494.1 hypothetical protein DB459_23870 [Bradyrhizobium sp. WD16]